jgi:hypothetical protein
VVRPGAATRPPGLNHIRAQDSRDQLHARLGQEQFEQAHAEATALSSDEAPPITTEALNTVPNGGSCPCPGAVL